MGRFMYVHFGDDVPRNIEKEYNKLLRKERYLEELDAKNGKIYPDFDDVLSSNPDPASIPISEARILFLQFQFRKVPLNPWQCSKRSLYGQVK